MKLFLCKLNLSNLKLSLYNWAFRGLFLFFLAVLVNFSGYKLFGSEPHNIPHILVTEDSLKICSYPYSLYGNSGITHIQDIRTGIFLDTIQFYFSPGVITSKSADIFIEIHQSRIDLYDRTKKIKSFLKKDIQIELPTLHTKIKFPDESEIIYNGDNWVLDSFINDSRFYAVLANGKILKINPFTDNTNPTDTTKMSFHDFALIKKNADKILEKEIDVDFEAPTKECVELRNSPHLEDKIKNQILTTTNISFTVFFDNCKPKILNYAETTDAPIYLFGILEEPITENENYEYYRIIKEIVENEDNWDCRLKVDKWIFSYLIQAHN